MGKINYERIDNSEISNEPFNHLIIDGFFREDFALELASRFPAEDDMLWRGNYNDALVIKKTCQDWSVFPSIFYQAFHELVSYAMVSVLINKFKIEGLVPDYGLHGGGLHTHSKGGKLNVHLDYHTHYKLPEFKRHLNLIVYLCMDWRDSYGGHLELWSSDASNKSPKSCINKISPKFNRAVIFDTTQNSWHGMPEPLDCPENLRRNSLAAYYLSPNDFASLRNRALFAPYKDQNGDEEVIRQITERAKNY